MTAPSTPVSASNELTVRRLHIDLTSEFDRHWCGGDAFMSAFCNALSMSFPVGEQFFIDSVKAGAQALPDTPDGAELAAVARQFVGQEATHRHLHGLYNAHLEKQGFKNAWGPRVQWRLDHVLNKRLAHNPKAHLHRLAITAAFEHFTAILGDLTLERIDQEGDWFRHAQEPLKTLWRWHAAEESEHKSVAFDLYQHLGGNHAWRMRWYAFVCLEFTLDVTRQTMNNLWRDGSLRKPSTWTSGFRFLLGRHGLLWRTAKPLWAYTRRDFHPTQVGHEALATQWLQSHSSQWSRVG